MAKGIATKAGAKATKRASKKAIKKPAKKQVKKIATKKAAKPKKAKNYGNKNRMIPIDVRSLINKYDYFFFDCDGVLWYGDKQIG